MSSSSCSLALRRTVALFLIPLVAAGCYSWRAAEVEPRTLIESEHPTEVRVTTQGTTPYVLLGPHIVADTLLGRRGKDSVAVALRDVTRVDVRQPQPLKTVGLILGIVVIGLGGLVAIAIAQNGIGS